GADPEARVSEPVERVEQHRRQDRLASMSYETLIWEQSEAVGRLTLNRPDRLNAWTAELGRELGQVLGGEAADPSVRAVLLSGAGRGFSSGADLKEGFDAAGDGRPDGAAGRADSCPEGARLGPRELRLPGRAASGGG